ncbi:hypothetical protein ELE36_18610 [Pseudolysobacter antarcticus]|uniref:DUF4279 domain-containing protein n=1 Tax=Pseudolysobacter antarcticus TaxID=2511995 RepID=A0A411HP05_9GAMM|nr:hypothetical protein [Pseudolysobacter antarcticus]QBB72215.1 hypothetical protein ELE36_18610 [Pseudolysobacter antarcticus]
MSCILRISAPSVEVMLSRMVLKPYRIENGVAHFYVSEAGFDDLAAQVSGAIEFLRANTAELRLMISENGASGVLDFAIEWRDVAVQYDRFPADLVSAAGSLGLALELSHYPAATR